MPHIDEELDPMFLQEGEEFRERPWGVTDREDRSRGCPQH